MASYKQVPLGPEPSPRQRAYAPQPPVQDSESEPLLMEGRRTPPPRYSSIGPSWSTTPEGQGVLGKIANQSSPDTPPSRPPPPASYSAPTATPSAVGSPSASPTAAPYPVPTTASPTAAQYPVPTTASPTAAPYPVLIPVTAPPPAPLPRPATAASALSSQSLSQQSLPESTLTNPGWWTWVPGPAQLFPPGLEHLTSAEHLIINKKGRRYKVVKDNMQIYSIWRDKLGDGCIKLRVQNNARLDVLILNRTKEARGCCSSNMHVEVSFPPGNLVGVVQGGALEYTIYNPSGDQLFCMEREPGRCKRKPGYQICTCEHDMVGSVWRQRMGCAGRKAMVINFPPTLDLRYKALLLAGAVTLRDCHW